MRAFILLLALGFISCNEGKFPNYNPEPLQQEQEAPAFYKVSFKTLHPSVTGKITASGILWIRGNQFYIKIYMSKGPKNLRLEQYIQREESCNFREDIPGSRLIPLDRDLRSQLARMQEFPTTASQGTYYYSQATFYNELMRDLRSRDVDPTDLLGKLERGEELDLSRRIIVIYGHDQRSLIPIACGEIEEDYSSSI